MNNIKFRFWLVNVIKSTVVLLGCNLIAYLLYTMFLNGTNTYSPEGASVPTVIFSLIMFSLSMIVFVKAALMGSGNSEKIDERTLLEKEYKENGYSVDYGAWFKDQFKTRLWGWFVPIVLGQIPIFSNYAVLSVVEEFETVFEMPIIFYKWNMTSIFGYELFGKLWMLGPVIYIILFVMIFTCFVYREQKKWLVKPSYIK